MTCKKYQNLITSYVQNELDNEEKMLLEKHLDLCPACSQMLVRERILVESINKDRVNLPVPDWDISWRAISKQEKYDREEKMLKTKKRYEVSFFKKRRWAMAGLALVIVMGLSLLIHQNFLRKPAMKEAALVKEESRVKITYAEIKGKKARPYVYQTPTMSFIWLAEDKKSGG